MSFILLFVLIAQLNVRGYANYTNECLCSTIDRPANRCRKLIGYLEINLSLSDYKTTA